LSVTPVTVNDNCGTNAGQITADAQGGTAPYMFQILPAGATAPTVGGPGWSSVNTLNAESGNYVVYVKDARNCPASAPVTIGLDPTPVVLATLDAQCNVTEGNFAVNVTVPTAGVAPYTFSIDGGAFQPGTASFTISNLSSGSHSVAIQDVNGCGNTSTVNILAPLAIRSEITLLPTCEDANGEITLFATGGTVSTPSSYIYTIDNWATQQASAIFTNLSSGTHVFKVRDIVTGCETTVTEDIAIPTLVTGITLAPMEVSCNGGSDGSIIVTLATSNNNPDYLYSLTGPINRIAQQSNIFDNLPFGNYTVNVTSGRGCSNSATTTVNQPDPIVVNAPVVTQFECNAGTNDTRYATITVNSVIGGSDNYLVYEFSKGGVVVQNSISNIYTETDLAGGSYTIRVFDDNNCVGSFMTPIAIAPFISMDEIGVTVVSPITCVDNETIQINVSTTGGIPATLNYTLTGVTGTVYNSTNTTGLFTDLIIGNYLVTVENPSTGCTITNYHYVFDPNTFVIEVTPINTEICFGASNGEVDLTFIDTQLNPTNDSGIFNYTITGPVSSTGTTSNAGPFRISNLTAGQYTVVATLVNAPECTVQANFIVDQPTEALSLNAQETPITCVADNSGTITAIGVGGWIGDYEYELLGPINVAYSDVSFFENLTAGIYTVNVRDSKGCVATDIVTLTIPDPITFTASADAPILSCFGGKDGSITVTTPAGGQGSNYTYTLNYILATETISSGPQTDNVFNGLGAGVYTITVTDGFSCSATSVEITIDEPLIVEASLVLETRLTCLSDATLTLSAQGGTAPYTYSEDGITYSSTSFNSQVTFPVTTGVHSYFVKDDLGCVSYISNNVPVEPLIPLTIELDVRNASVNCKGESTAIIVAEANGGLGEYEYSLLNDLGVEVRPAQADGIFADLLAGNYVVHVKSGNDCEENSRVIPVTEPENPLMVGHDVSHVKCFADKDGRITINASGGTGIIKYAIEPNLDQFVENNVFERLEAGIYTVIVQDLLGCNTILEIEVEQPEILIASLVPNSTIPELCEDDNNAEFIIEIRGGTAPYYESLDSENGPFTLVTGNIKHYTGLSGGKHEVYIKDARGCNTSAVEIDMPEPVILNPQFEISYECVNNASANMVTVTVDPSNTNPADIDYSLDGTAFQPSNIFTNIPAGTHTITARHSNGCEVATAPFTIVAVAPLTLSLTPGQQEMNVISVRAAGGAPAYEYSFNGEPFTSSSTYKIYKTGIYEIIVRDQNGCTDTITKEFPYFDVCIPNYFTPNGDGLYDEWGPGCTNIYNNLEFSIFDRYGRAIAKYRYGQKWDGRYNGEELPTGDYWYVLKLNDAKDAREFVGHFTLYR